MSSRPFNPSGKIIVVTGGASGIGAALCRAFVDAGASAIIVADINLRGADEICVQCKQRRHGELVAVAKRVDVTSDSEVASLIETTERDVGPIDLFVANAGVLPRTDGTELSGETALGGVFPDETEWDRVMNVNFRQMIHVAKHLVPRYLDRNRRGGGGNILITASAAGLLTLIGSVTYTTSKAAALSMAEWLAITFGTRGVGVSCLCPQYVRTAMTETVDESAFAGGGGFLLPEEVATCVMEALAAGQFLILPHSNVKGHISKKASDPERWIKGMRRLNDKFLNGLELRKAPGLSKL